MFRHNNNNNNINIIIIGIDTVPMFGETSKYVDSCSLYMILYRFFGRFLFTVIYILKCGGASGK